MRKIVSIFLSFVFCSVVMVPAFGANSANVDKIENNTEIHQVLSLNSEPAEINTAEKKDNATGDSLAAELVHTKPYFQRVIDYLFSRSGYIFSDSKDIVITNSSASLVEMSLTISYWECSSISNDLALDRWQDRDLKETTEFTAVFEACEWNEDIMYIFGSWEHFSKDADEKQYYLKLVGGTLYDFVFSKISPDVFTDTAVENPPKMLSDSEAWNLVINAYNLLKDTKMNYSGENPKYGYEKLSEDKKVYKKYNTIGKMREYSRTIFVDSIADNAWRYDMGHGVMVWNYSLSDDTQISPNTQYLMGMHTFELFDNYESAEIPTADEAQFVKASEDNGIVEYKVVLYTGDPEPGTLQPAYFVVRFMNTDNGWRIANCPFFAALSCGYSTCERVGGDFLLGPNDLWYDNAYSLAYNMLENGLFSEGKREDYRIALLRDDFPRLTAYLYKQNEKEQKAVFRIQRKNTAGEYEDIGLYDAIFKYENDQWNIAGGGFYDLTHNVANVAPYTGENDLDQITKYSAIILISIIAIVPALQRIIYRRKNII